MVLWNSVLDTFRVARYDLLGRLWTWALNADTSQMGQCGQIIETGYVCTASDTVELLSFAYTYDKVGNFSGDAITAGNRAIRVATDFHVGGVPSVDTMTYDADGNLLTRKSGALSQTFHWNSLGQLDSVRTSNPAYHNTTIYRYDPFGRRSFAIDLADTLQFLWDGDVSVAEINPDRTLAASYAYLPGQYTPHAMTRGDWSYYYLMDESNNVISLMRHDGTIMQNYRYWPFGFPYAQAEGIKNRFDFAGSYAEDGNALHYMRNRYYDFRTRRFISEDPIGLAGGINLYTYADNDPVNGSDPTGLQDNRRRCVRGHYVEDPDALEPGSQALTTWVCDEWRDLTNPFSDRFGKRDFLSGLMQFGSNVLAGAASWGSTDRANTGPGFRTGALLGFAGFFLPVAGGAGFRISFQSAHAARHLSGTGLSAAAVEAAIRSQVLSDISKASVVGSEFWGRVEVGGRLIEYRALQFAPGRINIGTYYFPRMY
ncbi:MAG: RHS repeat-associated core domain-containing protein [Gemmatimonadota bacterium]